MIVTLTLSGRRMLLVTDDTPVIRTIDDVTDLIGTGIASDTRLIAVSVAALDPSFFRLRTGFAGDALQKLVNYRFRLAVVGDVEPYVKASVAFRDLVREASRGESVFFVADHAALAERLASLPDSLFQG